MEEKGCGITERGAKWKNSSISSLMGQARKKEHCRRGKRRKDRKRRRVEGKEMIEREGRKRSKHGIVFY